MVSEDIHYSTGWLFNNK